MPPDYELFMSALPAQGVRLEQAPDGKTTLRGLPVLRPGVWNGRSYTAADLQALASNFLEIRESEAWTPPLRPYHLLDPEGRPARLDAREVLAWHTALTYDHEQELLTADLEVVDAATIAGLQNGQLRYVSAEIIRSGYVSPLTGKRYDTPVYYGAAFVDNPAVKGLPWRLVVNAAEVCQEEAEGTKQRPAGAGDEEGDRQMSWLETLKGLLRREGVGDEELAAVDQLAAPEAGSGLQAQVEQLLQTVREQEAALAQLRQARSEETVQATVDRLVAGGLVPPALRVPCLALVQVLAAQEQPVEVLAEGGSRQVPAVELLGELLAGLRPNLQPPAAGLWQGPEQLTSPPLSEDALDKLAALAGGTPKGGSKACS